MSNPRTNVILNQLRRLAAPAGEAASDRELLRRFVTSRDEEAFARLLRRHRPMVQGVSLRVLGNWHDSEDVVQATFLVLARKAGTLRWQESAASWLYRVAYHLSLKVRASAGRRQRREQQTPAKAMPDPFDDIRLSEAQALLDAELAALPDKYRTPLLLCCLQAVTRDEAARQLGWSLATLKRRLSKGRELLQARLARRGLTLSAALGASLLVPERGAAGVGAASARAVALAEGTLRAMTMAKWKVIAVVMLILSATVSGAGLLMRPEQSVPQTQQIPPTSVARTETEPWGGKDQYGDDLPPGALARFGTMRFRQGNSIYGLALSPDDRLLVAVGGNNVIHLWDATTGKEVRRFPEERRSSSTYAAAFSPDGQTFATGGHWGFNLWRTKTGEKLHYVEIGSVFSLAFAPDGKTLALGCLREGPSLWEVASGKQIASLEEFVPRPNTSPIRVGLRSLAFSPDGRRLASTQAHSVLLWDMATRQEIRRLEGHTNNVHTMAFSPDGKLLASGGEDRTIRLWDAATGRELRQFKGHEDVVTSLVFTPNGKTLVSGSGDPRGVKPQERHALRLWNVESGEERGAVGEHDCGAAAVVLSKKGTLLISADGGAVRLWDVATCREVHPFGGHRNWISGMAFSPDGKRIATGSGDRTIRLWDIATGRELRTLATCESIVDSVIFSPDGRLIAFSDRDGVIHLRDASSGHEVRTIRGHQAQDVWIAFSPDGTQLASAGRDATAALWDVTTGKELRRFKGDYDDFLCVAFSPDGKRIAAGELYSKRHGVADPTKAAPLVRVWDVTTGQQVHALRGHTNIMIDGIDFSPDGTILASTGWDRTTRLWDLATGEERGRLPAGGRAVAFSPDGRALATGGSDGIIILWEVATRKERARFPGHDGSITALAFSPDGRTLLSSSEDTTALLWDVRGRKGRSQPNPAEREKLWQALADTDAARAFQAINDLTADPQPAVSLLRERLHAVRAPDPNYLAHLLADLDSDRFEVREKAAKQIETIGELAKPALQKALAGKPSLEVRRRIEQLLANVEPIHSPEQRRALRALAVLEHIGSPEARRVLESLAGGAKEARLTCEAKVSLERLNKRP